MTAIVDLAQTARKNDYKYALLPFYKNGKPFEGETLKPKWGMTLRAAGSMRFRWNEENQNRLDFFKEHFPQKEILSLELIHSKIVFEVDQAGGTFGKRGDGILTGNKNLIPVVTAADCLPLCFFEEETGLFAAVHSGWKGTGIAANLVQMMKARGAAAKNILAAIGPHIRDCCYSVDKERAMYFSDNFGSDCVQKIQDSAGVESEADALGKNEDGLYRLSLLRANLNLLAAAGLLEENIVAAKNCTCCDDRFGSFRREASALELSQEEKSRLFTTQAAFVIIDGREKRIDET